MIKRLVLFLFWGLSTLAFAQNQNISLGNLFDGEPYMIINPNNPRHIVVAYMGYTFGQPFGVKTKVSMDGGDTWSSQVFLPHFSPNHQSADPSLAFDNTGNLFACYIDYRQSPDSGAIHIVKSTDGGYSWGDPTKVIDAYDDGLELPIDRPWFAINPVNNHFYVASMSAYWGATPNYSYFSASLDTGNTWQPWRYTDTVGFQIGSTITSPMTTLDVGSDGVVHCIYPTYESGQNPLPGFIHAQSSNSGTNFSHNGVLYSLPGTPSSLAKLGSNMKVDPSDPNHLVMAYPFKPFGGEYDVYMTESTDGGLNWTPQMVVNDDPPGNGVMQDLVWCNFDSDGDLVIAWRDRRAAAGTGYDTDSEIWGAIKYKDSSSFSPNFLLSDTLVPYDITYGPAKGNDFMCVDMENDTVYAVWGDVRTGSLNIWFSKKGVGAETIDVELISNEELPKLHVYPNPTVNELIVEWGEVNENVFLEIVDSKGSVLYSQVLTDVGSITIEVPYPAGMYWLKLHTSKGSYSKKIVIN